MTFLCLLSVEKVSAQITKMIFMLAMDCMSHCLSVVLWPTRPRQFRLQLASQGMWMSMLFKPAYEAETEVLTHKTEVTRHCKFWLRRDRGQASGCLEVAMT